MGTALNVGKSKYFDIHLVMCDDNDVDLSDVMALWSYFLV